MAVKVLRPEVAAGDPDMVARFLREGEALRAHAWLEHNRRPLGEPEAVEERFATLQGWTDVQ